MASIDGIQSSAQALAPNSGDQADVPAQTCTFGGEQAVVDNGTSALGDAAEEISLHVEEEVEHLSIDEREVESEPPVEIRDIEEVEAYLELAKRLDDPKELVELAKRMLSGQEDPGQLARREGRDPAEQYMLLQYALHEGIKSGAGDEALENVREALAELEIAHGPEIRSGINTIATASEFGKGRDEVAAFQATYRDVVLGEATLAKTLSLTLERLSGKEGDDFGRGLQGLIKALGQDLAAARPSTDPTRLQSLMQDLYHLEVAATVVSGCKDLAADLAARHGAAGVQPLALMKEMVAMTGEKWVGAARFSGLATSFGISGVAAQIAFLGGTQQLMREMPVQVFTDGDTRRSILDAAQEALDRAIDLEEEA
jgi:type III secretion protein W